MNYPLIKIPGFPIGMKNKNKTRCFHQGKIQKKRHIEKHGKKARTCGMRPGIVSGVSEAERIVLCVIMRRQWGRPMITGPVQVSFLFKIPSFPYNNRWDKSNAEQIYEDLLQEQKEGLDKDGEYVIKRVGSNIIQNDRQIQSHDGSRFWWLCECCEAGNPEKKTRSKRKSLNIPCPGTTQCPFASIEIFIQDYTRPQPTVNEINGIFCL